MKINKIAAGIAATTLFLGIGGAAYATIVADPALTIADSSVSSTDDVTFTVANVLVGCTVTTKLGSKTVTDVATATADGGDAADVGEILSQTIEAPYYAGIYDLTSKVSLSPFISLYPDQLMLSNMTTGIVLVAGLL